MISGRGGGTGKYSYREAHSGIYSVHVSHMPEDFNIIRIVFRHNGETGNPVLKISEKQAELLWSSLKRMAEDLKWDDRIATEIIEGKK